MRAGSEVEGGVEKGAEVVHGDGAGGHTGCVGCDLILLVDDFESARRQCRAGGGKLYLRRAYKEHIGQGFGGRYLEVLLHEGAAYHVEQLSLLAGSYQRVPCDLPAGRDGEQGRDDVCRAVGASLVSVAAETERGVARVTATVSAE